MVLTRWVTTGALMMAVGFGAQCKADTFTYTAVLSGPQEIPSNASTASGFAVVTLTGDILTVNETWSGLTVAATAAHIHCCTPAGVSAAVVIPFPSFPMTTSGSYTQSFNLSSFAFGGGLTEATFLAGLDSGLAYVNIHDANFPAGEIRGQLTATPEPSSLLLLGTAAAGLGEVLRRRVAA